MAETGLSGNEINGACVFPSRPRPASRSIGRIHISDVCYRAKFSLAKRSRSIQCRQEQTPFKKTTQYRMNPLLGDKGTNAVFQPSKLDCDGTQSTPKYGVTILTAMPTPMFH